MGRFADHLDSVVIEADVDSGTAWARLHGRERVEVGFAPGYYTHASLEQVSAKLTQVARKLFIARTKEFYRALSEITGTLVTREPEPATPEQERFRQQRNDLVAEGTSADGLVTVRSIGMVTWTVQVDPQAWSTMPEDMFTRDVGEAASAAVLRHRQLLGRGMYRDRGRP